MEKIETVYLFGDNGDNRTIYDNLGSRSGVLIGEASEEEIEKIVDAAKCATQRNVVVVNMQDEEKNLTVCKGFATRIAMASNEEKESLFLYLRISVFGDTKRQGVFEGVLRDAHGCIAYVDKHQQIAMDFIEKYPFAKFMDERHIDYQTSLVYKDVNINVFMLGFGKASRQIFFTSVANNQFLCEGEKEPSLKRVNYYIFDKKDVKSGEMDSSYYRYANEVSSYKSEDYLPLPSLPANEQYFQFSVTDEAVFDEIKGLSNREKDVNFAVIAFAEDKENIALAKKLLAKQKAWKTENLVVFVKSKAIRKEETDVVEKNCFFIGNERDCVFNIEEILGDRIYQMSQLRNAIYNLEYDITNGRVNVTAEDVRKNSESAMKAWFTSKSQIERDSSTYGCLSLRSKLNLMGLDYCGKEENDIPALTEEEYLALYAKGDMPDLTTYQVKADGKPIVCYTLNFPDSRRKTMAIHEHYRWNSFMLSKGMIPATKKQILEEQTEKKGKLCYTNGKNYEAHRHGNLTTFEGLVEFRKMVAKRDGVDEGEKDVIKYDYQLLDDAYWLLTRCGCKIIYKQ